MFPTLSIPSKQESLLIWGYSFLVKTGHRLAAMEIVTAGKHHLMTDGDLVNDIYYSRKWTKLIIFSKVSILEFEYFLARLFAIKKLQSG